MQKSSIDTKKNKRTRTLPGANEVTKNPFFPWKGPWANSHAANDDCVVVVASSSLPDGYSSPFGNSGVTLCSSSCCCCSEELISSSSLNALKGLLRKRRRYEKDPNPPFPKSMLFFFATMVVAKQARDPLAIMRRVYNKEKHRERCGVFFFSRKSEKKTLFRYEIFLSERTNVFVYVSINLLHTHR